MKRKITISLGNDKTEEREINYIPVRYIFAFLITLLEVLAIIGVMIVMCLYIPYFYIAVGVTTFAVELKIIASDDKYAIIGTINLDYRSLVHHFENGVWLYNCDSIMDLKNDILSTIDKSIAIEPKMLKTTYLNRFFRALVRIFAPML